MTTPNGTLTTKLVDAPLGNIGPLISGQSLTTNGIEEVYSPYDGTLVATVNLAGPNEIELSIATAVEAFEETKRMPSWQRSDVLEKVSAKISERREELALVIAREAGKPLKTARVEVDRAIFTFKVAAEETRRIYGEIIPLDWLPGTEGRTALIRREPRGPVSGITPFNFPLNLVAHKVAPSMAAGNPIIIKPSNQTPVSAYKLAEIVLQAGWPAGGIAVVPCAVQDVAPLVEDDRIKYLTFTGSPQVGWSLKAKAGMKPVTLELGGNAGTIIHKDADIEYAAGQVTWGGFSYAGQSCISVQRVYIHSAIYDAFVEALLPKVSALRSGDPLDETTDIGPMINAGQTARIGNWLEEAVNAGAQVLTGGTREGNVWKPTVLASVKEEMRVSCQEVFGPVISLYQYDDVQQAIAAVNSSDYGLQAGLFTNDWSLIEDAYRQISVGGLMVNDVSTFRVDHMPYGGVRQSGMGREGIKYAIEEMTEMKLLMIHKPPSAVAVR